MKKKILVIIMMLTLLIGSLGGLSAFAQVSLEECDRCFQTTMNALLNRGDVDGNTISAERKPVYDLFLQQLGYVYEYELVGGEGYAIIICDDGNYVAIEVSPRSQSPYAQMSEEEQCVYVNNSTYLKAVDGKLYDLDADAEISEEAFEYLKENAIVYKNSDAVDPEYVTVKINYSSYTNTDMYSMSYRTPMFCGSGLTGGCAAVAGGNVIGYFDRYYEDLIPNHEAGRYVSEYYLYNYEDAYVDEAINLLYSDMNGTANGISESNFKSGLQKYCLGKSLTCAFTSLMSSNKLNYSSVKTSMKNGRPVVLFLSTYNICKMEMFNDLNEHYMYYSNYPGNHVMVGFGYRDIAYVMANGSASSYNFIYVATGFLSPRDAYFNINYSTNIISAYGVNVY